MLDGVLGNREGLQWSWSKTSGVPEKSMGLLQGVAHTCEHVFYDF